MAKGKRNPVVPFSKKCVLCGKAYDHDGSERCIYPELRARVWENNEVVGFSEEPQEGWDSHDGACVWCIAAIRVWVAKSWE